MDNTTNYKIINRIMLSFLKIFLFACTVLITIVKASSSNYTVLSYSGNGKTRITYPSGAEGPQYQTNRAAQIPQFLQARWFWSGNQYIVTCPMNITAQDQIQIVCLNQLISFYVTADNFFDAQFLGQYFSGDNQSYFYHVEVDPSNLQCNGTYNFKIHARNKVLPTIQQTCYPNNGAAIIYGVLQYQGAEGCCMNNSYFYQRASCNCVHCDEVIDHCKTCDKSKNCLSCKNGYALDNNKCQSVCGDGLKTKQEQCDDGNIAAGDGCNSTCFIQQYHNCSVGLLVKSVCVFDGPCHQITNNCQTCTNMTDCLGCKIGYGLKSNLCEPVCGDGLKTIEEECDDGNNIAGDGCDITCNIQKYYGCSDIQFAQSACALNVPCNYIFNHCLTCTNASVCLSCMLGYVLDNNQCNSVCGNGFKTIEQECDDGNNVGGDGCDSYCHIEENYSCNDDLLVQTVCVFNVTFRLYVKEVIKQYYLNKVTVVMRIRPTFDILNAVDMLRAFVSISSLESVSYNYYSNGLILLHYNFSETLQSQIVPFIFDLQRVHYNYRAIQPVNINVTMTTNSNIPVVWYSERVYDLGRLFKQLFSYLTYVSCFIGILSLCVNKIVLIDLSLVLQVSYFSLSNTKLVHPLLTHLFRYKYLNGYNPNIGFAPRKVPDPIFNIGFFEDIYHNFNSSLLIILGVLFIFLISLFVNCFAKKYKYITLNFKNRLIDCLLTLMLFFCISAGYSIGLQLRYGENTILNLSIVLVTLLLFVTIFIIQLWTIFQSEFKQQLKNTRNEKLYFNVNLLYRFIFGMAMSSFNDCFFISFIIFSLSVCFLVYQLSINPFNKAYFSYCSTFSQTTVSTIMFIRMIYSLKTRNYYNVNQDEIILGGKVQMILLTICVLISLASIVYSTWKKVRQFKKAFVSKQKQSQQNLKVIEYAQNLSMIGLQSKSICQDQKMITNASA